SRDFSGVVARNKCANPASAFRTQRRHGGSMTTPRFTTTAGRRMTGGPDWQPGEGTRLYHQALEQLIEQETEAAIPSGYEQAIAARRAAQGLGPADAVVMRDGIADPYRTALARRRP